MGETSDRNHEESMLTPFSTPDAVVMSQVGGKAASLIRLQQAGFTVPNGVVLTTVFFEAWLAEIQVSSEWLSVIDMLQADCEVPPNPQQHSEFAQACDSVKSLAFALPITAEQRAHLDKVEPELGAGSYAVRSSSPEEDLGGASFAGLYETVLGVDSESFTDAVRTCFCSCLDARVLLYKFEKNFESSAPTIAVVVQRLIDSEVSGVAFSLNPLTNDFDEVLINASWGLGEALVTGDITPDAIVFDSVENEIIDYRVGEKGGDRSEEECLTGEQISELADTVKRIEAHYDQPVDVEWAFSADTLHVLQARPITAYVPLHESMLTKPREPRHLYYDNYLADGVTMSVATTPMCDEAIDLLTRLLSEWAFGIPAKEIDFSSFGFHGRTTRMYVDFSMIMHLMGSKKTLAKQSESMNPLMAGVIMSPEYETYRPAKPPKHLRITRLLRYMPGMLWRTRQAVLVLLEPMFRSDRFERNYEEKLREFDDWITRPMDYVRSVDDCLTEGFTRAGSISIISTYPAFMYSLFKTTRIKKLVNAKSPEQVALAAAVCSSYEDDIIVQMGLAMYDLSTLIPATEFDDIEALEAKIKRREMSPEILACWDDFVRRFGCRGPLEMELANPKYGEAPGLALRQIASIARGGSDFNPRDMQRKQIARREQAYETLLEILPRRKVKRLRKAYAVCVRYAASRELMKHHIMLVYARVRKLLLHRADEFIETGRLDTREQIFDLGIDDVDRAAKDPKFDIRAAASERGAFSHKLKAHVRHFPMFIDSRGRILRAPVKREEGAIVGAAVSPGIARGPVKVLNDPFEKEVQPGDILVAVTTDPGWTPLFVPAAAVILEIGGELQHGAIVAREYGKPCVSGIQDVTSQFEDGQIVEVNGDTGVVRFIEAPSAVS